MTILNIDLTSDEYYDLVKTTNNVVLEISQYAPKGLRIIDSLFEKLKKKPQDAETKSLLVKEISKFTGIKNVILTIKPNLFNATILPVYKSAFPTKIFGTIGEIIHNRSYTKRPVNPKTMKSLTSVEESANNISEIIVVFGEILIKELAAEECTAILLHELGHVFSKTASWPYVIPFITKKLFYFSATVTSFLKLFSTIPVQILGLITFITLIGIHGLTFLERAGEYASDNYAARYGYGEELVSVLHKVAGYRLTIKEKQKFYKKILTAIISFIESIFFPSVHPDERERILNLKKRITEDFREMYPDLSQEIMYIFTERAT